MTTPAAERPHRLTLSEIVSLMLSKGGREHSSVTLTRNAKGETQIEVAVRTGEDEAVATAEQAAATCRRVYDSLRAAFPLQSGYVGARPPAGPLERVGAPTTDAQL